MKLEIDELQVNREIDTLAEFSDSEAPAVTRVVFSEQDRKARSWLKDRCREAGLTVREDAIGNTFARWAGRKPELPPVATGSHVDAIPHAGKYDGVVGVLGGLEAIRALQRVGFTPERSVELVIFTSEEPTRFGIGCLGSRLMSGILAPDAAAALHDVEGNALDVVRQSAGFAGALDSVRLSDGEYGAFVELHIEQGPSSSGSRLRSGWSRASPLPRASASSLRVRVAMQAADLCPVDAMRSVAQQRSSGCRVCGGEYGCSRHGRDRWHLPSAPRRNQFHPQPGTADSRPA